MRGVWLLFRSMPISLVLLIAVTTATPFVLPGVRSGDSSSRSENQGVTSGLPLAEAIRSPRLAWFGPAPGFLPRS
jgi:hypothetical protein